MISYHVYDPKLNGEVHQCAVCLRTPTHVDEQTGNIMGMAVQHHVAGRGYDERCIWVCPLTCHPKIHANPAWARKRGFMLERTNDMSSGKTRTCKHSTKTQNRWIDGKLVPHCLFCGQPVKEIGFGVKKPVKPTERFKQEYPDSPQQTAKMGFEQQDPRIAEAEKLKKQYVALKRTVNRNLGTPEELAHAKERMKEVEDQMKALEATYHED